MRKILLLALVVIAIQAATDKEVIQQTLNGLFEQNKLADPVTIVTCLDDPTAHKIVLFIGEVLDKAAKGSISDLISLVDLIKNFGDSIPQSVKDCLDGNKEFEALGLKYGIDNNTDGAALEKKIITYVTLHYLAVHQDLGNLNSNWKAGKAFQVGNDAAVLGHKVLGISKKVSNLIVPTITDKEILQQGLNGLFEENKLPDPVTILPCIDDDTAHKLVVFIGQVLDKAGKGSISDLLSLVDLIKKFGDTIPQPVKDCLDGNAEFKNLGLKYHIDDTTDTAALEKKIISYVTLHYLEVHKTLGTIDGEWKAGKFYQAGTDGATLGHKILGITLAEIAAARQMI